MHCKLQKFRKVPQGIASKMNTKMLTKIAYKGILPPEIINKPKTGWTVPIGYWLTQKLDPKITKFYQSRQRLSWPEDSFPIVVDLKYFQLKILLMSEQKIDAFY